MGEQIIVKFTDAGDPVISVKGVAGKGCKAMTKAIENALGATTNDRLTSEYHEEEKERARRNA